MSVNKALENILEGNLDAMRTHFSNALATKAVEKLEERKIDIAQSYFGQVMEEAEQIDEAKDSYQKYMKRLVGKAGNSPKDEGKWSKKMKKQEKVASGK